MKMRDIEERILSDNRTLGTDFSIERQYGNWELWANGRRLEAGTPREIYQAWIKHRFTEKAKKNPWQVVQSGNNELVESFDNDDFASAQSLANEKNRAEGYNKYRIIGMHRGERPEYDPLDRPHLIDFGSGEAKRGRGRPRKPVDSETETQPKRGRGRPRKVVANPIDRAAYNLWRRIWERTYHRIPDDQLSPTELSLIAKFGDWFETENGYIFALKREYRKYKRERRNPRNGSLTDKFKRGIDDVSKMFQGAIRKGRKYLAASDIQPKVTARLGELKKIIVKNPQQGRVVISFDGDAMLSADRRKNLYISGEGSRLTNIQLPKSGLEYLGTLYQVNYVTDKAHIENGEITEYYHPFGEINRERPNVFVDKDGFLHVLGGDYDIWQEGIVN